jgi:F0F1-type ATP synthase membrane subunit b/b'
MRVVVDILKSLGLNETVVPQFFIFIATFIFLNYFVFNKYLAAYQERRRRTVDSKDVDNEIQTAINSREAEYSREAKEINEQIKAIYDQSKKESQEIVNKTISEAQAQHQEKIADGKKSIDAAVSAARAQLKNSVPEIGQMIKQRLLER